MVRRGRALRRWHVPARLPARPRSGRRLDVTRSDNPPGTVKLVSGAAEADDLGVDTQPEGGSAWARWPDPGLDRGLRSPRLGPQRIRPGHRVHPGAGPRWKVRGETRRMSRHRRRSGGSVTCAPAAITERFRSVTVGRAILTSHRS